MSDIQSTVLALLPSKRKQNPSGWLSVNAPCCVHRGESRDTKMRGGIMLGADGSFIYHCFNCQFNCGWGLGKLLSGNTKLFLRWLGLADDEISKLGLYALRVKDSATPQEKTLNFDLAEIKLPDNCKSINEWIKEGNQDPDLLAVINYIVDERKMGWDWYPWHWCPNTGYRDRVIIPFYNHGKIVGYIGRKITKGEPKYLKHSQGGYVFNLDRQTFDRKYLLILEGQFDAIAVDGVAIMSNAANEVQCARINAHNKEVILVPDQDRPGANLIKAALEHSWMVSVPPWERGTKDTAEAVRKYGRLYTLSTILHYREHNPSKIQIIRKKLEHDYEE